MNPLLQKSGVKKKQTRNSWKQRKLNRDFKKPSKSLNRIANQELRTVEGPVEIAEGKKPDIPSAPPSITFQFGIPFATIVTAKRETLYLKASVPVVVGDGVRINIMSDSPEVIVLDPTQTVEANQSVNGICTFKIHVEGRQVGATDYNSG